MRACFRTHNRAFINPQTDQFKVQAALRICGACPHLQQCAREALTAGHLADGTRSVANGVIMAGIICTGDQSTAQALAAAAGVQPPREARGPVARNIATGKSCRNCDTPLWKFTRNKSEIPDGYNMLHGRGFCVKCRAAYNQDVANNPVEPHLRRPPTRRPRHCVDCALPMVAVGHTPGTGQVGHFSRGLCKECYADHSRKGPKKIPLTFPRDCATCARPMVQSGQERPPGHVAHGGYGECSTCREHTRRRTQPRA